MKIQSIQFPSVKTSTEEAAFFRRSNDDTEFLLDNERIQFDKHASIWFDTYFNSFSLEKWKKYTLLGNLSLTLKYKGRFQVKILQCVRSDLRVITNVLSTHELSSVEDVAEQTIQLEDLPDAGIIGFYLYALEEDSLFLGGSYNTDTQGLALNRVHLALAICTFRREKYVERNMRNLRTEVFDNADSPMRGNLDVFISDNGKTLDINKLQTDNIHIFPNINAGGSGGFTRALMEIVRFNERTDGRVTHVIMMDDDLSFSTESLLRTYNLLRMLKPEHKDAFVGGAMLVIDETYRQIEIGNKYDGLWGRPIKENYDIRRLDDVVKNELEDKFNYLGWWFCCMPVDVIRRDNLPLPLFIKRDDIEYSLRNGRKFITLNGICVWHESFHKKGTPFLEYYYWRNACIINAIHLPEFSYQNMRKLLFKRVTKQVLHLRYKDAMLCIRAVDDFLKGIDWLKEQDVEALHKEIMDSSYKLEPLENLDFDFAQDAFEPKLWVNWGDGERNLIKKYNRSLKSMLAKNDLEAIVPVVEPRSHFFYKVGRAMHYEEVSGRGFVTERDNKEMRRVYRAYAKLDRKMARQYNKVRDEYRERYGEITNMEFWEKYLSV